MNMDISINMDIPGLEENLTTCFSLKIMNFPVIINCNIFFQFFDAEFVSTGRCSKQNRTAMEMHKQNYFSRLSIQTMYTNILLFLMWS